MGERPGSIGEPGPSLQGALPVVDQAVEALLSGGLLARPPGSDP